MAENISDEDKLKELSKSINTKIYVLTQDNGRRTKPDLDRYVFITNGNTHEYNKHYEPQI